MNEENAEARSEEYLEMAKRIKADFENYKKRVAREREGDVQRGRAEMLLRLVPVFDSLRLALEAAREGSENKAFLQGLELVQADLLVALEEADIAIEDPTGEEFDPLLHEAVSLQASEEKSGTVLETLEVGYRSGAGVIRAAKVIVSE